MTSSVWRIAELFVRSVDVEQKYSTWLYDCEVVDGIVVAESVYMINCRRRGQRRAAAGMTMSRCDGDCLIANAALAGRSQPSGLLASGLGRRVVGSSVSTRARAGLDVRRVSASCAR